MENKTISIDGVEYNCTPIEKKVEKAFEILSFKTQDKICIVIGNDQVILPFGTYSVEECLSGHTKLAKIRLYAHGNPIPIYSVKRTSDGEIFTVEDKITGTLSLEENPKKLGYTTIKGFYLEDDKLCIEIPTGVVRNHKYSGLAINTITKYVEKPVLFTTEDGVDIRVGDASYGVDINRNIYSGTYVWNKLEYFSKTSLSPNVKYFSTKEKAKEYADPKEKVYSKEDIKKVLGSKYFVGSDYLLEQLERNRNI